MTFLFQKLYKPAMAGTVGLQSSYTRDTHPLVTVQVHYLAYDRVHLSSPVFNVWPVQSTI